MKKLSKKILITTLIFTLFLITISTTSAADVHINTTNNTISNVIENETNSSDIIYLDEGTYYHTHLNTTEGININKNLTIIGKGTDKTIIDAEGNGRIFNITSEGILTLINLTLTNGNATNGGAIHNYGKVTITNCTFNNNTANREGGAIYNNVGVNFTIRGSTFNNNTATYGGV